MSKPCSAMNIRWLDSAEEELLNIVRLERRLLGLEVATQVYDDVILRVEALSKFPFLGTLETFVNYHGLEIRVLHGRYTRVFYTINYDEILVLMVWDNRRDSSLIESTLLSK